MAEPKGKLKEALEKGLKEKGYEVVKLLSNNQNSSPSASRVYLTNYQMGKNGEKSEPSELSEISESSKISEQRAVKVYSAFMLDDIQGVNLNKLDERTQKEVDIYKKINHPNIPKFFEAFKAPFGDFGTIDVLAMQYIDANNLLQRLEKGQKLNEEEARMVLKVVLPALNHVHTELGEQILHRDIKPSNILFDGKYAYLFDFNFSKIGAGTSNTTMIDNFGYYPSDVYSGRQTPSQDLVALGNTIVALGYGKEISDIRAMQGKEGLSAVSVEDLLFSPRLKRFLRKLVAENPAFRYQTAKQAISDLAKLDEMNEIELDQRATTIMRDECLIKLVEKLQKEDHLFNYNVPPNIRDGYDDDSLLGHLEKTYKKSEFIIENPDEVRRYARPGDRVVCKENFLDYIAKNGSKGKLKEIKDGKVIVSFNKDRTLEVDPVDLFINDGGKEKPVLEYITGRYEGSAFFGNKRWREVAGLEALTKKDELIYRGKPVIGEASVPKGSEGLIAYEDENDLAIVFENRSGLKLDWKMYYPGGGGHSFRPHWTFNPKHVILIVKNYIDFDKLYKEAFIPTSQVKK